MEKDLTILSNLKQKMIDAKIKLSPVLDINEIIKFEKKHRIELPKEYRMFITNISDGASNINSGMEIPKLLKSTQNFIASEEYTSLHKKFMFTKEWRWEEEGNSSAKPKLKYGVINIGYYGEGNYVLVVNGKEYGHIWDIDSVGLFPFKGSFIDYINVWIKGDDFSELYDKTKSK